MFKVALFVAGGVLQVSTPFMFLDHRDVYIAVATFLVGSLLLAWAVYISDDPAQEGDKATFLVLLSTFTLLGGLLVASIAYDVVQPTDVVAGTEG